MNMFAPRIKLNGGTKQDRLSITASVRQILGAHAWITDFHTMGPISLTIHFETSLASVSPLLNALGAVPGLKLAGPHGESLDEIARSVVAEATAAAVAKTDAAASSSSNSGQGEGEIPGTLQIFFTGSTSSFLD